MNKKVYRIIKTVSYMLIATLLGAWLLLNIDRSIKGGSTPGVYELIVGVNADGTCELTRVIDIDEYMENTGGPEDGPGYQYYPLADLIITDVVRLDGLAVAPGDSIYNHEDLFMNGIATRVDSVITEGAQVFIYGNHPVDTKEKTRDNQNRE